MLAMAGTSIQWGIWEFVRCVGGLREGEGDPAKWSLIILYGQISSTCQMLVWRTRLEG